MPGKNQHIVKHPKGWAVKSANGKNPTSIHDTQKEAIEAGKRIAGSRRPELIIHRLDGTISEKIVTVKIPTLRKAEPR